jgi:hypothetical protein
MQTKRTYQVQYWPNGQWDPQYNWRKVEASSEKEAAEKVCGRALTNRGTLAKLSRSGSHIRRFQTAQRHIVLRRGIESQAAARGRARSSDNPPSIELLPRWYLTPRAPARRPPFGEA